MIIVWEGSKHKTEYQLKALFLPTVNFLHQGGWCCSDKKKILPVFNQLKGITQNVHWRFACWNRTSNHDHMALQWCQRKHGYLLDLQRKKKNRSDGGRRRLRDLLWFMCFTSGRGHQGRTQQRLEFQHEPYGCYSLDSLCSKTKYFFKWLCCSGPGTYAHTLSLFPFMEQLVCVSWLMFCLRTFGFICHCDRQIYVTIALYVVSLRQDELCRCSSNWVWNHLSSYTFLCLQLINNALKIFW